MNDKHKNMIRAFTHTGRSWYRDSVLPFEKYKDEVIFGLYDEDGGTTGEMTIQWIKHENLIPKLNCFDDGWEVLYSFSDVLKEMALVDNKNITPMQFCAILIKCGFKDLTKETR